MNNGWQITTLDQISVNLDSQRVPITKADRTSGEYPYYGASGIVDYVADYIFDGDTLLVSEDGANLLARSTPIAFPASGKYWVNNHAHILKFGNLTTQRFVELYLESIPLDDYVTGMAQPKLTQKALNSIPIPVPTLADQRRIVGILDEAFDGIAIAKANTEKNLHNARALFERYLEAVFIQRGEGCVEKSLRDCVTDISTGPFGSLLHKSDYEHGGIPLVNPINIEGDKIIPDERKAVGKATAQKLVRYALRENDIVIGRRGEIGRCAVVLRDQVGWLCGTGSFFIRPSDKTDPHYLAHLLRSRPYRGRLEGVAARATMPSISNDDLANLVICLPPMAQQRQTLALLGSLSDETQRLESLYQRKLAALDELKKSLLHQAFSGEL